MNLSLRFLSKEKNRQITAEAILSHEEMEDAWILKNIGMDADELLRLKQLTGLASLFADKEFSKSWIVE